MKSSKLSNKYKYLILFVILFQIGLIFSEKADAKNPNIILPSMIPMTAPGLVLNKYFIKF